MRAGVGQNKHHPAQSVAEQLRGSLLFDIERREGHVRTTQGWRRATLRVFDSHNEMSNRKDAHFVADERASAEYTVQQRLADVLRRLQGVLQERRVENIHYETSRAAQGAILGHDHQPLSDEHENMVEYVL